MRFKFNNNSPIQGRPIYSVQEYAFGFEKFPPAGASFVIDTLQVAFELDNLRVLCVWGYCPYQQWKAKVIFPPTFQPGQIFIENDENIQMFPGIAIRFKEFGEWLIYMNPKTGWVCIGDPDMKGNIDAVEFATNIVAVLSEGELKAIWIKPENLLQDFDERGIKIE